LEAGSGKAEEGKGKSKAPKSIVHSLKTSGAGTWDQRTEGNPFQPNKLSKTLFIHLDFFKIAVIVAIINKGPSFIGGPVSF
jgi:hypothetical protein